MKVHYDIPKPVDRICICWRYGATSPLAICNDREHWCRVMPKDLNDYAKEVHEANAKWWVDLDTGEPINRNVGELLMLVTSELSEALEGHRKNLMDDKLPHRKMFEVEIADAVIRLLDISSGFDLDLDGAYQEKMAYNKTRQDHTVESRKAANGKKY